MKSLEYIIFFFLNLVCMISGCSPPEGGFKEPTPAEIVHYAEHVVVGEVTEILRPDPRYGDMYKDSVYGAMVTVQCTYKGSPLPGRIKIGGAGFVPGLCTAKHLEKGIHYVLFLHEKRQNEDMYEQSNTAVNKSQIGDYLGVCGLELVYPEEKGITLQRKSCPPVSKLDNCQQYGINISSPKPVNLDNQTKTPPQKGQESIETRQQNAGAVENTTPKGDAAHVMTSLASSLIPVLLMLLK